jgi:hypothetical protein
MGGAHPKKNLFLLKNNKNNFNFRVFLVSIKWLPPKKFYEDLKKQTFFYNWRMLGQVSLGYVISYQDIEKIRVFLLRV